MECGGYKKDFKWRPFVEEQNGKVIANGSNAKVNAGPKQKRGTHTQSHLCRYDTGYMVLTSTTVMMDDVASYATKSADSSRPTTPHFAKTPPTSDPKGRSKSEELPGKKDSVFESDKRLSGLSKIDNATTEKSKRPAVRKGTKSTSSVDTFSNDDNTPPSFIPEDLPSTLPPSDNVNLDFLQPGSLSHLTPGLGLSPTLTEILLPWNQDNPAHQDFVSYHLTDGFQMSPMPHPQDTDMPDHHMTENSIDAMMDDDMENLNHMALNSQHNSPTPPRGSRSSTNTPSGGLNYIYPRPRISPRSADFLTAYYEQKTCGILSIINGPDENPWRTLIWPLAQQSPALYHAVTAMTAYHAAFEFPALKVQGHEHKMHSLRYIREGISNDTMTVHAAIATSLALGFSDSWDQHVITGNSHIKGAQANLRRAIEMHRRNPHEGVDLQRLKFLCNSWVYMDVIARLTSVDSDESNDFDNAFLFSRNPGERANVILGDTSPGFGIDFGGMPVDSRLDPLMGCANTLFPLIGRVANLVRKVCRSETNSPAIITQANDLKTSLEDWDPPNFIEQPQDPTTDIAHTLQTAEAYRWATLLHLHSAVPELPSLSSRDLAERVMQYIATVPRTSRTVKVQIYPLMVAGCEARSEDDRQWVRERWTAMHTRLGIGVIEKCLMVTEEVWRRRDDFENQPLSNRRLVPTAELHPSRVRHQPSVRTPTGDMETGRTGVVFSYVGGEAEGSEQGGNKNFKGRERRDGRDPRMNGMHAAYTVRGHCHWVGVSWHWAWESKSWTSCCCVAC